MQLTYQGAIHPQRKEKKLHFSMYLIQLLSVVNSYNHSKVKKLNQSLI